VDPIAEGYPYDREVEPDPDWSRAVLADEQ
jgi:hypothetical protein